MIMHLLTVSHGALLKGGELAAVPHIKQFHNVCLLPDQVVEVLHAAPGSPETQELRQILQAPHFEASAC